MVRIATQALATVVIIAGCMAMSSMQGAHAENVLIATFKVPLDFKNMLKVSNNVKVRCAVQDKTQTMLGIADEHVSFGTSLLKTVEVSVFGKKETAHKAVSYYCSARIWYSAHYAVISESGPDIAKPRPGTPYKGNTGKLPLFPLAKLPVIKFP